MIGKLWSKIFRRRNAYRMLFLDGDGHPNPVAETVLADLKRFCKAQTSTVYVSPVSRTIDPIAMAMAEGRREVWNRIQSYLQISDKEIAQLQEPSDE
jgi:hypothetical protein